MVIVVEGIDRVGKTTLCKKLSEKTGYKILKRENADIDNVTLKDKSFITYGDVNGTIELVNNGFLDNVIMDRFNWTEAIYGYIDRKCASSFYLMKKAQTVIDKSNKWIYVYVKPVDINRSSSEHGKDLSAHLKMYEEMAMYSNVEYLVKCNYMTIDRAVNDVINIIKENKL